MVLNINTKTRKNEVKEKTCYYPHCNASIFIDVCTNKKFCNEHSKKKYFKERREIEKRKRLEEERKNFEKNNQILKHNYSVVTEKEIYCELCDKKFIIELYPGQYTYPKFCREHRNEWKRYLYKKINDIEK